MNAEELKQARKDKKLLSNVSKMPGYSISRSAWLCNVGSRLADKPGSTCADCYARKGMYHMPNVKAKMIEREEFFNAPDFVPRMVNVLNIVRSEWFRWFDSGDVADVGMALNILEVCRQTPTSDIGFRRASSRSGRAPYRSTACPRTRSCVCPPTWWTDHGPRHGRPRRPCTQESKPCPAESARRPSSKANAASAAPAGPVMFRMFPIIYTNPPRNTDRESRSVFFYARSPQLSTAQARSASPAARSGPFHTYAGAGAEAHRSMVRVSWITAAFPPSNKNTSPVEGSCTKKKLAPPQRVCAKCQAICEVDKDTRLFLIIFNSHQTGTPSMHRYTSGIPCPARFSIRWKWVFLGKFCFKEFHRLRSVLGIFDPFHVVECVGIFLPDGSESGDDLFTRKLVKLMNVCRFPTVDCQTTKCGPDLLGIDRGRKLPGLFGSDGQVLEPLQLIQQRDAVSTLPRLPQFLDQFRHLWECLAVEKFRRLHVGTAFGIARLPRALGVAVSALDIILGKFSLPVRQPGWSTYFAHSDIFCPLQFEKPKINVHPDS